MNIITWLVLAALVAWLARTFATSDGYGAIGDTGFAALGALAIGFLATVSVGGSLGVFSFSGVIGAVAGAVIAIRVSHAVAERRASRTS